MKIKQVIEKLQQCDPEEDFYIVDSDSESIEVSAIGMCRGTGVVAAVPAALLNYTIGRYSSYYHFKEL